MKAFVYGYANGYDALEQIAPVVGRCVNELLKLDCRIVWNPSVCHSRSEGGNRSASSAE